MNTMFLAIDGSQLIGTLIWLIIIGVIFGILWWLISYCALPAPFDKVCRIILALFAAILVINVLLGLVGHPLIDWRGH